MLNERGVNLSSFCPPPRIPVVDGLLYLRKTVVGCIGASVTVAVMAVERSFDSGEILWRNNTIRVEEYEVSAVGALHAVVAGYAASFVGLIIVMDVQPVVIPVGNFVARDGRTVFDKHDVEVFA